MKEEEEDYFDLECLTLITPSEHNHPHNASMPPNGL